MMRLQPSLLSSRPPPLARNRGALIGREGSSRAHSVCTWFLGQPSNRHLDHDLDDGCEQIPSASFADLLPHLVVTKLSEKVIVSALAATRIITQLARNGPSVPFLILSYHTELYKTLVHLALSEDLDLLLQRFPPVYAQLQEDQQ